MALFGVFCDPDPFPPVSSLVLVLEPDKDFTHV